VGTLFEFLLPILITAGMVGLYYATKSLDKSYGTTAYSANWVPDTNADVSSGDTARVLPLGVLPARLQLSQQLLAVVPRDASLAPVAERLMTDLAARYPSLNVSLPPPFGNLYVPSLHVRAVWAVFVPFPSLGMPSRTLPRPTGRDAHLSV
jgi:hypothetical protein